MKFSISLVHSKQEGSFMAYRIFCNSKSGPQIYAAPQIEALFSNRSELSEAAPPINYFQINSHVWGSSRGPLVMRYHIFKSFSTKNLMIADSQARRLDFLNSIIRSLPGARIQHVK